MVLHLEENFALSAILLISMNICARAGKGQQWRDANNCGG